MALSPEARLAWRQRREERREKQRALNVVRAKQMHALRTAYELTHAPSPAPPPPPSTLQVGCSGWYYWHWKGDFYPADLPGSKWFDHYASTFRTVELNAPFYLWPTPATVATWIRQAGRRRFTYTVKVNELITHTKRFARTADDVRAFGHIADLLGPRMGCFLFQLPPSVRYSAPLLSRILKQLDPRRRNVVEFRHKSWWDEKVFRAFRDTNTIFCSTSGPRLPSDLVKTADDVYVRFHGTTQWYRHDYSKAELAEWTQKIRASGAKTVWAYFNNDREGNAIRNARELLRQLKAQ
ncbi:MAG TPA: DUF72 domain-containing protein [Tepidisphaeraceae bacterium]|nr:DUF72 domain-containing protein [Tepidisphaeraceae bacterium]